MKSEQELSKMAYWHVVNKTKAQCIEFESHEEVDTYSEYKQMWRRILGVNEDGEKQKPARS